LKKERMVEQEGPALKDIGREFTTPGYWKRARERKKASKSGWDLVFLAIGFAAIGTYWYLQTKAFLLFHLLIHPADAARLKTLTSGPLTAAHALIFLVPIFSSIPLGFMTSNALMWLLPPARRASEARAK